MGVWIDATGNGVLNWVAREKPGKVRLSESENPHRPPAHTLPEVDYEEYTQEQLEAGAKLAREAWATLKKSRS
jgi:hypothetical protein